MVRRQMGVPHHHLKRRPAPQFHQLLKAGTALHVPRRPGVPQIVPAEFLNPRSQGRVRIACREVFRQSRIVIVVEDTLPRLCGRLAIWLFEVGPASTSASTDAAWASICGGG